MAPHLHRQIAVKPAEDAAPSADAHHAARSAAVQALTIVVQAVIFLTQLAFARLYGQVIYGGYVILVAAMDLCARGGALGAPSSTLRYVAGARAAGDQEGVRRALGSGLRMALAGGCIVGLALALGLGAYLPKVSPFTATALRLMAPAPLLAACLAVLIQASLGARVTRANFWVKGVFEPLALFAAGVTAWALGAGLRGLALAYVSAGAVTFLIAVRVVGRVFEPAEKRALLTAPTVVGFTRFALPLGTADLLNAVLQSADVLIVGAFAGEAAVAIYAVSERITRVVANIRYAFDAIVAGMLAESLGLDERARAQASLRLVTRWVITVAAPIAGAVIVLREDLLVKLLSPSYASGAAALLVLTVSHLVNASLGLTGWALVAGGRSRLVLLNNVVAVAFNISVGILLTRRFGLVGMAISVLGSALLVQGMAVVQVGLWLRIHPFAPSLWKPGLAVALAFAAESAVHAVVPNAALRIAAVIVAGLVVYGGALLAFGLPPEERRLFDRLLARLR
jgi:O-antigen/teichoic acid export membrane protein